MGKKIQNSYALLLAAIGKNIFFLSQEKSNKWCTTLDHNNALMSLGLLIQPLLLLLGDSNIAVNQHNFICQKLNDFDILQ